MELSLKIEKDGETPIYRQIIEQVTRKVRSGELSPGDLLPAERELADDLSIARGTIKKAYEELLHSGVIEVVRGRGTFVSRKQDILGEGRKERAVTLITALVDQLRSMKFSYREIGTFVHLILADHERRFNELSIAAVDCNPEALSIFERQLRYLSQVKVNRFLLDDLRADTLLREAFAEFDLILTTSTHYAELIGLLPDARERIFQAAVSPSQKTIIELATIPAAPSIGIITRSVQFRRIIENRLAPLGVDASGADHRFEADLVNPHEFLRNKTVLIVPPDLVPPDAPAYAAAVRDFVERGGRLVVFEYQIERGSLIYIEEQIVERMRRTQ